MATLPVRLGGLGLPDYSFIQPHARAASKELAAEFETFLETFQHPPPPSDLCSGVDTAEGAQDPRGGAAGDARRPPPHRHD